MDVSKEITHLNVCEENCPQIILDMESKGKYTKISFVPERSRKFSEYSDYGTLNETVDSVNLTLEENESEKLKNNLEQEIETLKTKNELLILQSKLNAESIDDLSYSLKVEKGKNLKKEKELIKCIVDNERLLEDRVILEEQNNRTENKKNILIQENEKYRILNLELEKEVTDLEIKREKDALNIEILQKRNYETEIKLSKMIKYIYQ